VKFLIDMPLSPQLAVWFRQQNHDAIHSLERGLNRASDAAILEYAGKEHRIVVTADLDYPRLLAL
jgi:predicted nuclease of predicted toxin-antitoxin system